MRFDHSSGIMIKKSEGVQSRMNTGIANIDIITRILKQNTAKDIAEGTGIKIGTIKKLKSGERSVDRMNLSDAIKLTEYGKSSLSAKITIWRE